MKRIHLLVLLSAFALPLAAASASGSGSGSVVVAEVFAAGGNSGAAYAKAYGATAPWDSVQNGHWFWAETNAANNSRSPTDQSEGPRMTRWRAAENGCPNISQ